MQQIGTVLPVISRSGNASSPPSSEETQLPMPISQDSQGAAEMGLMLAQSFDTLKLYGKQPEQLESAIAMFRLVLADYPIGKIRTAFAVYFKRHSEFPAPADIVQIIERDGKPPLERAVYIAISKKQPEDRTSSDWAYAREYEKYAKTGAY